LETRANYVIVGLVTMAVLLASFGFVYWIARFGDTQDSVSLEIRIPGSVTGLSVGSQVLFNGIKVGDVKALTIDLADPNAVIAMTDVSIQTPVTEKTQATLGFQGLTGQAYIELKGGDPNALNILEQSLKTGDQARIEADPGAVNNLISQAQAIATKANTVLGGLETFVNSNQKPLSETIANANKFSKALGDNSDQIDAFLSSVGVLSKTLNGVSGRLDSTLASAEDLLKSVDKAKIDRILANTDKATSDIAASTGQLKSIADGINISVKNISELTGKAKSSLEKVDQLLEAADAQKLKATLANIEEASKTANQAMADISKVTKKIGERANDIDQIVVNTKELSGRLNQTAVRVDGVLEKVSSFLGNTEGQGPGLVEEARSTLIAFRKVADTLNAKLGSITGNIEKFSGRGLSNVDALVQDTRRSINRIEQAIGDLEKDPQRLIFGGQGTVPRYNDRKRR
jgi:phospholipid/cholesterol/gamma-HCH transport system substrate-binding protein